MDGKNKTAVTALLLGLPILLLVSILMITVIEEDDANLACGTGLGVGIPAAYVNPASVPQGPIAGYSREQLVNAAYVMTAAQKLGLSVRDQQIGVMTAMGESGLRVIDYGDAAGPDSRGLFQQRANGAWGSYEDRMDPFVSSTNFFKVEATIAGRDALEPTIVAHRVQRNADPYYYRPFWEAAGQVVAALGNVQTGPVAVPAVATSSRYNLGAVQPQLTALVNVLGPMFSIQTVGGYRASATDPNGHPAGLAADFMVPMNAAGKATGDALAAYAQVHAAELDVDYMIWRQRIWSLERAAEGWRPMEDRGNATENHMDHVHINVYPTGSGSSAAAPARAACFSNAAAIGGSWIRPLDAPITSDYGPRSSPTEGASSFHNGVDFGAACGTPFRAASGGLVVSAGPASGYGHWVQIDHGGGVITTYGHMYSNGVLVRVGDRVSTGQAIGLVGSDGTSTGCHLHFQIEVNGQSTDPIKFLSTAASTVPVSTGGGGITVGTFNALGASHTDGNNPERPTFADSTTRARAMVQMLNGSGVAVAGLQEFQPTQQRVFDQLAGSAWNGFAIQDNAVVWRDDQFRLLGTDKLAIPYFSGNTRQMPVVRLQHRASNTTIVVLSVHNPADKFGSAAHWRAEAIRIERAYVDRVRRTSGAPVLLIGDFNDRDRAFCDVTAGGLLTTGAGGTNTASGCNPPNNMPVDWIFGSGLRWQAFAIDRSVMGSISDHPFVAARAGAQ